MTGADIVGALLRAHAPLTTIVPSTAIKGGSLPEGQSLPALLVRTISLVDQQPLRRTGWCRSVARVGVTVRAASYREQNAIIALVRTCCSGRTGNIGGGVRVSVTTMGLGPDIVGPGNSYEQTQDFRVSFDEQV